MFDAIAVSVRQTTGVNQKEMEIKKDQAEVKSLAAKRAILQERVDQMTK